MPMELVPPVTPPEPEAIRDELETLQDTVTMHTCRLTAMEEEGRELGNHLGQIEQLASALKIRCSEGDGDAVTQLDALEAEQRTIERRREGLALRIVSLQSELQPLVRRSSELAIEREARRQDAVVREIEVAKDRLIKDILNRWTEACEASFALMELLDSAMAGRQTLDQEHKARILALNTDIHQRTQRAALAHINEQHKFEFRYSEVFKQLEIVPARRKELARAAG